MTAGNIDIVLDEILHNTDSNRNTMLFSSLAQSLRPEKKENNAVEKVAHLVERLENDGALRECMQQLITSLFNQRSCFSLLTRVGVLSGSGFFAEFSKQLSHRILPPMPDKRSLEYTVQHTFDSRKDYIWVRSVPDELWAKLFGMFAFDLYKDSQRLCKYLTDTLTVLSYRVSTLGLEEEINIHIETDDKLTGPFLEQNRIAILLVQAVQYGNKELVNSHASELDEQLGKCSEMLNTVRKNSEKYGTSLSQTYLLVRTEQQIKRILHVVSLLRTDDDLQAELKMSVRLFKDIVESENKRTSIKELLHKNIGLLAYQIAEHKGNTGEHYITTTRKQYNRFFVAAAGGGAIISFIALLKTLLHHLHPAPFWEYFLYGLNYAIGFILLQVTHTTLATKQPGMTASTLASYLDLRKEKNKKNTSYTVAHSFVLIWRSQTASFIGNLIIVFPLSYLLAYGHKYFFGHHLTSLAEAHQYLNNQNPLLVPAWWYACLTGVFLFLSALITGYVDNSVRFRNIPARVREHPLLRKFVKGTRRDKIAVYIDKNLGGFAGNLALGFFLGFAPLIGRSLGIPFDIRHITISTANFAFGLCGLDNKVPPIELVTVIIGVLGIGAFNFLVSFGLAFWVAVRSRGMSLRHYIPVIPLIFRYSLRYPFDFILAPRRARDLKKIYKELRTDAQQPTEAVA